MNCLSGNRIGLNVLGQTVLCSIAGFGQAHEKVMKHLIEGDKVDLIPGLEIVKKCSPILCILVPPNAHDV
jgi:hypothetical protein